MENLNAIKRNISVSLKLLDLNEEVSLEEIEKEISQVDTAFQSLLLLGILRRIMHRGDDEAAKLFVPAVTAWKNYLPHPELCGLSPAQTIEKYPPGPRERFFMSELMREYQAQLESRGDSQADSQDGAFDVETDFANFQNEYLQRIPAEHAFAAGNSGLATIRDIIIEERRKAGRPEESIEKIGLKIFAENIAENLGEKAAALDDQYINALQDLETARNQPNLRNKARVRAIRKQFKRDELYHRCGPAPHQFYGNYAAVVFLDDQEAKDLVLSLLERSLSLKPDYEYALAMKRRLQAYYQNQ